MKQVSIPAAVIIGGSLFYYPDSANRRRALQALQDIIIMVEDLQEEVRNLKCKNRVRDQIARGE